MNTDEQASAGIPDVTDLVRRAEEAKARLQLVASTVTSKDGAATVTVNASGALQQLAFGPKADEIPRSQLAASVLATAHQAQAQAAQQLTAVMAPLIGADSDAMTFLSEQIPVPDVAEEEPPASESKEWNFVSEQDSEQDEIPPAAPAAPAAPPRTPRSTRRRPPDDEDDDGYEYGSIFQGGQ